MRIREIVENLAWQQQNMMAWWEQVVMNTGWYTVLLVVASLDAFGLGVLMGFAWCAVL
jgi:hypothetical protein